MSWHPSVVRSRRFPAAIQVDPERELNGAIVLSPTFEDGKRAIDIEPAKPYDAEAIWEVYAAGRLASQPNEELGIAQESVREYIYGPDDLIKSFEIIEWRNRAAQPSSTQASFVARQAEKIVGVVRADVVDGTRWLNKLYVSPEMGGQGIGHELIQQVLDWHEHQEVNLKVASYNERAQKLYAHMGFTVVQELEQTYEIAGIRVPQLQMTRPAPADLLN